MPSHTRLHLTTSQTILKSGWLIIVFYVTLYTFATTFLSRLKAGWPTKRILAIAFLKSRTIIPRDLRTGLDQPTGESIRTFCATKALTHKSFNIKCDGKIPDATLHEVLINTAPKYDSKRAFLYFHGGGYESPLAALGHAPMAVQFAHAARADHVFILEYNLAPALKYPGQLVQVVAAMELLLDRFEPGQIIIGGDSAGGNLTLALISHIIKPSPYAPKLAKVGTGSEHQLLGALVISPWVHMGAEAQSFVSNAGYDFISAQGLYRSVAKFGPKAEVWADGLNAEKGFWKEMPVTKTLITIGSWEILLDDALELAKNMGAKNVEDDKYAPVQLHVAPAEIHVQCVVDTAIQLPDTGSKVEMLKWLNNFGK